MSVEAAKAFAERVAKDPAIQAKLSAEGADPVAIAKEHGHDFDESHVEAGKAHLETLEMSDDELDDVAGGSVILTQRKMIGGKKSINPSPYPCFYTTF